MSRRKAEMVLELIDRATRPARRFIAMQRRMGKAVELANRLATRSARTASRATDLYKRAVKGLGRAQDALQRGIRRSNDMIRRQVTQMRNATGMMRNGAMGLGRAGLLAGTMLTAYAGSVALAGTALLAPARQFEKFQTILTTTEGSAAAAKEAMGWVENFAVKTPYELDQVMGAFVQLRAYGLDPTNGMLKSLGDASAAMGKPLMQSVEAMADAVTGENERLKELGIKAAKVGEYFEYSYTGKDGTDKVVRALATDRKAIQAAILGIFDEKYAGSMDLLAETFDGMTSNIMDIWTKFQRMIAASGVFDWMKGKLSLLLETLNAWDENGRLEAYAVAIGTYITSSLEAMWTFGGEMVRFWQKLYPWIESTANALGGWRNLALALLAIPLRGVLMGLAVAFLQIAGGAAWAAKSVALIGFGGAAKGVLIFGKALLGLANPINWVKGAFMALRVALIATGIGALVVGLAMAGLWIYNNWSGLKSFFKGFGEAFMKSLGPAQPLAERVIRTVRKLWEWIARLTGPLDASAEQWAEWGRAAGRWTGEALAAVQRFFDRVRGWFSGTLNFDIANLFTPLSWGAALIPLLTFATFRKLAVGGVRLGVGLLFRPLVWSAKLLARLWPSTLLKLAVGGVRLGVGLLFKPLVWSAKLLTRLWPSTLLKLATGGVKLALTSLIAPLSWTSKLIGKVPWLRLAGGGAKFGLVKLIRPIIWTTKILGGPIGWALLLGELLWSLLIKPIVWDDLDLNWNWDWINPLDLASKLSLSWSKIGSPAGAAAAAEQNKKPKRPVYQGTTPMIPRITEKARGGSFGPGWLLTGEEGPELEYKSRGGFIAHNKALRNMAAMSEKITRSTANSNRAPSWLKGAAVASSMAASAALPAAAGDLDGIPAGASPDGSKYLTQTSRSATTISAPISLTINGNVDKSVMPDIERALAEVEERIAARFEDDARAARRREHG